MNKMVITGATSGVGLALSKHFAEREWSVVGLARNADRLRELENKLENFSGISTDIRMYDEVASAFMDVGQIDVLVNNAAVYVRSPWEEHLVYDIGNVIDTNLLGTIYVTYCSIHHLKQYSRIINISSVAALEGIENESIYCASKHGVDGFMKSLSLELSDKKIQITTIYPGGINTPLWNDTNKYPGNVSDLLITEDIVKEVDNVISLRPGVIKEKVVLYSSTESN